MSFSLKNIGRAIGFGRNVFPSIRLIQYLYSIFMNPPKIWRKNSLQPRNLRRRTVGFKCSFLNWADGMESVTAQFVSLWWFHWKDIVYQYWSTFEVSSDICINLKWFQRHVASSTGSPGHILDKGLHTLYTGLQMKCYHSTVMASSTDFSGFVFSSRNTWGMLFHTSFHFIHTVSEKLSFVCYLCSLNFPYFAPHHFISSSAFWHWHKYQLDYMLISKTQLWSGLSAAFSVNELVAFTQVELLKRTHNSETHPH